MDKPTDQIKETSQDDNNDITTSDQDFLDEIHSGGKVSEMKSSDDASGDDSFKSLYEQSLKTMQEGELVSGEIVMIGKEYVLVDIGYKSEGQIRLNEFIDAEGNVTAKVGDKIDVLLEKREDEDGRIILSMEKAAKIKIWDEIKRIYEEDGTIRGQIVSRLKGGMAVDIGLQAFLPGSQIDLKPIKNFDSLIGTRHDFKILKYNKRRSNIVLSRRAILEKDRKSMRETTLQKNRRRLRCYRDRKKHNRLWPFYRPWWNRWSASYYGYIMGQSGSSFGAVSSRRPDYCEGTEI